MIIFVAFYLSVLCIGAHAFTAARLPSRAPIRSTLPSTAMTSLDLDPSPMSSSADAPNNSNNNVELWLDLRDTAILPRAAMAHMKESNWLPAAADSDEMSCIAIDKVLVSENDVARVLKQWDDNGPDILYVVNKGNTIRNVQDSASDVVGGVISLQEDEFADPIPSLDILSNGGWVVIDSDDIQDEEKRDQAIMGLVEFLSAGASSSATSGSLLLGGDDELKAADDEGKDPNAEAVGGIVLRCGSKSDVLRAGASSQSIVTSGSLTTTDGGILVQAEPSSSSSESKGLKAAVAVPFDAMLWKAVSVVFGQDDNDSLS